MSRVFKEPLIFAGRSRVLLLLDMPVGVAYASSRLLTR